MKTARLPDMVGGWFIGNFNPSVLKTAEVEVAVKRYRSGDRDDAHYHKIAAEVTAIISGEAVMRGRKWQSGDIIVLEPGEPSEFVALTDVVLVAVKVPSAPDDKYMVADVPNEV